MKKLSILVLIAMLTLVMSAAVASGSGKGWWWTNNPFKYFHGTFEMIASGSCIHSEEGYTKTITDLGASLFTPINPAKIYVGTTVAEGTWIFKRDGKGTYTINNYATILPGGPGYPTGLPFVKQSILTDVPFDFVVTPFGDITVTVGQDPPAGTGKIQLFGSISIDKKTMTLLSANQIQVFGAPLWYTICNTARTLIKVED